jgi:hypothetical protein
MLPVCGSTHSALLGAKSSNLAHTIAAANGITVASLVSIAASDSGVARAFESPEDFIALVRSLESESMPGVIEMSPPTGAL